MEPHLVLVKAQTVCYSESGTETFRSFLRYILRLILRYRIVWYSTIREEVARFVSTAAVESWTDKFSTRFRI